MSTRVIYARYTDDRFRGATLSGTAPSSSYSLDTLQSGNPAQRVRWGTGTVTVTATLDEEKECTELVIPVSNLDEDGSDPSVLSVTNAAGLNVLVPVPPIPIDGIPAGIAIDLVDAEPDAGVRTSNVWNIIVDGNSENLILGGMVGLYGPQRVLDTLEWEFSYRIQRGVEEVLNEYLQRYRQDYQTQVRQIVCSILVDAEAGELAALETWFRAQSGSVFPGLLWPIDEAGLEPYVGTWQPTFEARRVRGSSHYTVALTFAELSKGKPV